MTRRLAAVARWWRAGLLLALVVPWLYRLWAIDQSGGLFSLLGIDYALYWAQSTVLHSAEPWRMYDLGALASNLSVFAPYARHPADDLVAGPVPYPPIFAWLFTPMTWFSPPAGRVVWTVLSVLALGYTLWHAAQALPTTSRFWLATVTLTSIPVGLAFTTGQPILLLGAAFVQACLCLRAGRDFRAGLWLATLAIKPQYGLLVVPLLLWKRRWAALLGGLVGCLAVVLVSLLVAGPQALLAYPSSVLDDAGFYGSTLAIPQLMLNWRAAVLVLRPGIGERTAILAMGAASLLTLLPAIALWRGPWEPTDGTFGARLTALVTATLLVNYHSNIHGGVLLILPLAWLLAERGSDRLTVWLVAAIAVAPTLLIISLDHFVWRGLIQRHPPDAIIVAPMLPVLLLALLWVLAWPEQPRALAARFAGPARRTTLAVSPPPGPA